MRIAFRCDASIDVGSGHVMRCMTLANELTDQGANCDFFCREYKGNLLDLIRENGHRAVPLSAPSRTLSLQHTSNDNDGLGTSGKDDALQSIANLAQASPSGQFDWVVVDHYGIDSRWEYELRDLTRKILVIDDLANRNHHCDLLLDQNFGRSTADYDLKVPVGAKILAGTEYALLRSQFALFRETSLSRRVDPRLKKILVTMGGMDSENITCRALTSIEKSNLPDDVEVSVVMGHRAPWLAEVKQLAARMRVKTAVRVAVHEMAQLMTESDLMIGAGGSTTWERCALGLPAITVVVAENQEEVARKMSDLGSTLLVSLGQDIEDQLLRALNSTSLEVLSRLSLASQGICDAQGASRVVREMLLAEER